MCCEPFFELHVLHFSTAPPLCCLSLLNYYGRHDRIYAQSVSSWEGAYVCVLLARDPRRPIGLHLLPPISVAVSVSQCLVSEGDVGLHYPETNWHTVYDKDTHTSGSPALSLAAV